MVSHHTQASIYFATLICLFGLIQTQSWLQNMEWIVFFCFIFPCIPLSAPPHDRSTHMCQDLHEL